MDVKVTANNSQEPVAGGVISFAVPSTGSSAVLSDATAIIGGNDVASVTAMANSHAGGYTVAASARGVAAAADFALTNQVTPTVALAGPAGSPVYGQPVTLTATVSSSAGASPSGMVSFYDGTTVLGTAPVDSSGTATLSATKLVLGANTITAHYNGDPIFVGVSSSSSVSVRIGQAESHVVVVPQAVFAKKKVKSLGLKIEIEPMSPSMSGVPTGTVTLELMQGKGKKRKAKMLGTAPLSSATATLATKATSVLKKSIKILYSGDADFQPSTLSTTITTKSLTPLVRPMVRSSSRPGSGE